jgi:hypothetical protein
MAVAFRAVSSVQGEGRRSGVTVARRAAPSILLILATCLACLMLASPASAANTGAISGTVRLGAPPYGGLPGAAVSVCSDYAAMQVVGSATTDASGTYAVTGLPAGSYTVKFAKVGHLTQYWSYVTYYYAASWVTVDGITPVTGINAYLSPSAVIAGKVTKPTGQVAPGVRVYAQTHGGPYYFYQTDTDSNGDYRLDVPAGDYKLQFDPQSNLDVLGQYWNGKADNQSADLLEVRLGTTQTINVQLEAAGQIHGVLHDELGNPVVGAWVYPSILSFYDTWTGWSPSEMADTQADGSFVVGNLKPGLYRLYYHGGGCLEQNYRQKSDSNFATNILVTAGSVTEVSDVLQRAASVSGTVTLPGGGHAAGVKASAFRRTPQGGWSRIAFAKTGSNGTYTIANLAAGEYRVSFAPPTTYLAQAYDGKPTLAEGDSFQLAVGETRTGVNAHLTAGCSISGTVTNGAHNPVKWLGVIAYVQDGGGEWRQAARTSTTYQGHYTLRSLPAGAYKVRFDGEEDGYADAYWNGKGTLETADSLTLAAGASVVSIDAQLAPGGSISGRITSPNGDPVTDATVVAYRGLKGEWVCWKDAGSGPDGRYSIGGLAAGTYRLGVQPGPAYLREFYADKAKLVEGTNIAVAGGAETPNVDVHLNAAGTVSGTVLSGGGELGGIVVSAYAQDAYGDWTYAADTSSDAMGRYTLGGLTTGNYRLEFQGNHDYVTRYWHAKTTFVDADLLPVALGNESRNIDEDLPQAGYIEGVVTDAVTGHAMRNVAATAGHPDGLGGWVWSDTAVTRSDGSYTLGGLAAGDWIVKFESTLRRNGGYITQFWDGATSAEGAWASHKISVAEAATSGPANAHLVPGGGSITGTLHEAGGAAAAAVSVHVYRVLGTGELVLYNTRTSGADGTYRMDGLPAGPYRVGFFDSEVRTRAVQFYSGCAAIDDAATVTVGPGAITAGIDGTLAAAGHVTGMVTNAGGTPLRGIVVTAYTSDGNGGWQPVLGDETDFRGHYDIAGLATARYQIEFSDPSEAYATEYYANRLRLGDAADVFVTAGGTVPAIDEVLARSCHITGRVEGAVGHQPVSGVKVKVFRPSAAGIWQEYRDKYFITADDGLYDIGGLPAGDYKVQFWLPASDGRYCGQFSSGKDSLGSADVVSLMPGATAHLAAAELTAPATVAGTVKTQADDPLFGVTVTAYQQNADTWEPLGADASVDAVATDEAGRFTTQSLPVGDWRLRFWISDPSFATVWYSGAAFSFGATGIHLTSGAEYPLPLVHLPPAGHVVGLVQNADSTPLMGISVEAYSPTTSPDSSGWEYASDATTNALGRYDLGKLPSSDYVIRFSDQSGIYASQWYAGQPFWSPTLLNPVHVTAGSVASGTDVELAPAGHIVGTVTGAGGRPLGGATVEARAGTTSGFSRLAASAFAPSAGELVGTAITDAGGSYDVTGLPPGSYALTFADARGAYADGTAGVTVTTGGAARANAALTPDTSIQSLQSPTHPDQAAWCGLTAATFTWQPTDATGVSGYSFEFDHSATTVPDQIVDGESPSKSYVGLASGSWYFHVRARSTVTGADSWGATRHVRIGVDSEAPSTTVSGADGAWHSGPVTLTFSVAAGPSGLSGVDYRLGGAEWTAATPSGSGWTATVAQEGSTTVAYRARSVTGAVEAEKSCVVHIDGSAPSTAVSGAGSGWSRRPVTLTLTPSAGPSGVARVEYRTGSGAWTAAAEAGSAWIATVSAEGVSTVSYRAISAAGVVESPKTCEVRIDSKAPTPAVKNAHVKTKKKVTISFRVADPLPSCGAADIRLEVLMRTKVKKTVTVKAASTNSWRTCSFVCKLPAGKYTIRISATDIAGNPQTRTAKATLTVTR